MRRHASASRRVAEISSSALAEARTVSAGISCRFGVPSLDLLLGRLPWGLVEVFGAESVGKTGLLYHIAAAAQQEGFLVILLATEALDVRYMESLGVDASLIPTLLGARSVPDLIDFIQQHTHVVVLIDSISALRPAVDGPGDWNAAAYELLYEVQDGLREGSCAVVASQVRARMMSRVGTRSSSWRVEDFFDTRLELSRTNLSDTSYTQIVNVVAHPLRRPGQVIELPATKGRGIDLDRDRVRALVMSGDVVKRGSAYYFHDTFLGQGELGAARALREAAV